MNGRDIPIHICVKCKLPGTVENPIEFTMHESCFREYVLGVCNGIRSGEYGEDKKQEFLKAEKESK